MAAIQCTAISTWPQHPSAPSTSSKLMMSLAMPEKYKLRQSSREATSEALKERTRKELKALTQYFDPVRGMKLIDNLNWLGIGYHFEEEIHLFLEKLTEWDSREYDLHATALCFRLLRQQRRPVSCDVFEKFMEGHNNRNFKKSLIEDKEGLLNLYEASYLGTNYDDDDVLSEAMKFTGTQLKSVARNAWSSDAALSRRISRALELPRHLRMARLESRLYIEDCGMQFHKSSHLLELARLDYNNVQLLHHMEIAQFRRWWKQLGLMGKLGFARDPEAECFFWAVGIFPESKYSCVRMEIAKTVAILIIIDDVFDKYGTIHDLTLFTQAVQRWDVNAIENLPEYMKLCYIALYNTTQEIAQKILKEQGIDVLHFLARVWIDTIEAYMTELKWFQNGQLPIVEDYIENGVTTGGAYMALVHAFFLIGEGITNHNIQFMLKPYPKLFSTTGRILRLWDDLGTSKEEQDQGDNASLITVLMNEKNVASEEEARDHIKQLLMKSWREMNENLLDSNTWPLSLINVCFNMCRTSQTIYNHQEHSYMSSFKRIAKLKLLEPIRII